MDYYEANNYFPDSGLRAGVEDALNRIDLIGHENDWDLGAKDWSGDATLEDYFLSRIYYILIQNASSIEGLEKLKNLWFLDLERSSVTDFSSLANSFSLQNLVYKKSQLSEIDPSIFGIGSLFSLNISENNLAEIPEVPTSSNIQYLNLELNLLDFSDPDILNSINDIKLRGINVIYETQFPQALLNLSQRLADSPDASSAKENFLHGFEILIGLGEDESFKQLILKSGEVNDAFSAFTLADFHGNIETFENESGEIDESADIKDVESFLRYDSRFKLETCMEYLKIAANIGDEFIIDQAYTGSVDEIRVDKGDILMCLAIANGLHGFVEFATSYNWKHNIKDAETLNDMDQVSMETVLKDQKLLALQSSSQLINSRESFISAFDYYNQSMAIIEQRIGEEYLFTLNEEDIDDKNQVTADLAEFISVISSESYTMGDDEFSGDKAVISPDALFSGRFDPINQLPQSEAGFLSVIGNSFTTSAVDDPTFGGFFPNWDQEYLTQKLLDWEMLDTNASAMSSAKLVSSQEEWYHSGWLGYFFRPNGQNDDSKFYAYHQFLGWIRVVSTSSESTWILTIGGDSSNNVLYWTRPTLFPYLYDYYAGTWHYLSTEGTLLTWNPQNKTWKE